RVVRLPAAPGTEEALALRERPSGVRGRIEEDMDVVEGRTQAERARAQHAVPEHVAAGIPDAGHVERRAVGIDAELAKVRPHALPPPARRDAQCLVVIAMRAAGREG